MTVDSKMRYRVTLSGAFSLLLVLALWSMPLQAQDGHAYLQSATDIATLTPLPNSIALLLTINTSSCVLSLMALETQTPTPRATYVPTLTPIPPTVDPNAPATPEPFNLANAPTYAIGAGCDAVVERLSIPQNDVLWISLMVDGDDVTFLPLQTVPDDPYPPHLDARGRYFGCRIPESGQQVCQVAVMISDQAYIVQIPVNVEDAYFGSEFTPEVTVAP